MWLMLPLMLTAQAKPEVPQESWDPGITSLVLEDTAGDIEVHTGGDRIRVRAIPVESGPDCSLQTQTVGGVAQVVFRALKPHARCEMDFEVTLPAATSLTVSLGAGDIDVRGVRGDVDVELGAGDLTLDVAEARVAVGAGDVSGTVTGPLTAEIGAGDVDLQGMGSPARVEVGVGTLSLAYDRAPVGEVAAEVGVGSIEVELPAGTKVRSSANPAAATVLELNAGLGQVTVR